MLTLALLDYVFLFVVDGLTHQKKKKVCIKINVFVSVKQAEPLSEEEEYALYVSPWC